MKKLLLLTLTAVTVSAVANAQITKGTILVGGNISTASDKTDSDAMEGSKSSTYYLNPSVGFTFKDNNVVGFNLTYGHTKAKQEDRKTESDTYGAGVFYRRYFTLGKGFYLFGQANVGYTLMDSEQRYLDSRHTGRQHSFSLGLYPGVSYALTKRFHLEVGMNNLLNLSYSTSKARLIYPTWQRESKSSGVLFNTNANRQTDISAGFRIALGK